MEKVFAMSEGERFDLARFSNLPEFPTNPDQRRYNEKDYSCKYLLNIYLLNIKHYVHGVCVRTGACILNYLII